VVEFFGTPRDWPRKADVAGVVGVFGPQARGHQEAALADCGLTGALALRCAASRDSALAAAGWWETPAEMRG